MAYYVIVAENWRLEYTVQVVFLQAVSQSTILKIARRTGSLCRNQATPTAQTEYL